MSKENRQEYVDEADAVRRLAGNRAIYKTLLTKFQKGDHFTPIETAISARDAKEAANAAHALKGLSANLSLPKIREIAAQVEAFCRQGELTGLPLAELKEALTVTGEIIDEIITSEG